MQETIGVTGFHSTDREQFEEFGVSFSPLPEVVLAMENREHAEAVANSCGGMVLRRIVVRHDWVPAKSSGAA